MKKTIKNIFILPSLLFITIAVSCKQNDYLVFDEEYAGIYFTQDSLHYSFSTMPIETRTHTVEIPVKIMGKPFSIARNFSVEVLPAIHNTEPMAGIQYQLESDGMIVEPDSITGHINLIILRDGLEGNDDSGYTRYELRLKLTENSHFSPTLSDKDQNVVVTFDNAVERPSWYSEAVWLSKCGEWHPLKLIKIMEYFHSILKDNAPSTYDKMVADIGENWEKVQFGWPTDYNYTVKKYILIPCYEYFLSHPEHGIIDFPNPNEN